MTIVCSYVDVTIAGEELLTASDERDVFIMHVAPVAIAQILSPFKPTNVFKPASGGIIHDPMGFFLFFSEEYHAVQFRQTIDRSLDFCY